MRLEMLEMTGEVGVKWTVRLLNVCGPDSADMEEERGSA